MSKMIENQLFRNEAKLDTTIVLAFAVLRHHVHIV